MTYQAKFRYKGDVAEQYDALRSDDPKWKREQEVIRGVVAGFGEGVSILDIPVGTGRFLEFYKHGRHTVFGIDASEDMLAQARKRWSKVEDADNTTVNFSAGSAEQLPFADTSIDYVICVRLLNWVPPGDLARILKECVRVARRGVVIGIRFEERSGAADVFRYGLSAAGRLLRDPAIFFRRRKKGAVPVRDDGYVLHDRPATFGLFKEAGFEIFRSFWVDTEYDLHAGKVRPYRIYHLKPRPCGGPGLKVYVVSSPCSGKTAFVKKTGGTYKGLRVEDFDDIVAKIKEEKKGAYPNVFSKELGEREKEYHKICVSFLCGQSGPACILDAIGPKDPGSYKDIVFVAVLPPLSKVLIYLFLRRFSDRAGRWSSLRSVLAYRRKVLAYAREYDIPVRGDFRTALDGVLSQGGSRS